MSEDYEFHEEPCPKCGHEPTHWMRCYEIDCEGGWVDVSDENYELEGTSHMPCSTCNGYGCMQWCPKCGFDLLETKDYDY